MSCYSPIKGYRGRDGIVRFQRPTDTMIVLAEVPCGQCIGCRMDKSRDWALRCIHEAQSHQENSFVTLTYEDSQLPLVGSLNVRHWQLFAKRLRHRIQQEPFRTPQETPKPPRKTFRFFHCGEYGEREGRPHYHAAIFGLDFHEDRKFYKVKRGNTYYTSKILEDTWGHGFAIIGELTFQSAAYVARYITKKITGDQAAAHYQHIDQATGAVSQLKPEYTTMSRRPGIGKNWFEKYRTDVFPHDYVVANGARCRTPKYYDNEYELSDADDFALIRAQRRRLAARRIKNNTPERLAVRERVQEAKYKLLKRPIE